MRSPTSIGAWPASLAAASVIGLALAGLAPVFVFAGGAHFAVPDASIWSIVRFTLVQATLSTVLSVALAIPAARALSRHRFLGRAALMVLLTLPQALPAIVAVLALVTVFGNSGWFGGLISIYGLGGILIVHVFFNFPLATRIFVQALDNVSTENLRLAQQLSFDSTAHWRLIDWPALRPSLPRAAALIFLLCASSFVIVLTLGGPSATTLEVAIYQSLRMDFDVARALTLSLCQIALCGVMVWMVGGLALLEPQQFSRGGGTRQVFEAPSASPVAQAVDAISLMALTVMLVLPALAILVSGVTHLTPSATMLRAAITSLGIAAGSALLALALAWPLARGIAQAGPRQTFLTIASLLGLIVPPAVVATGWFLLVRPLQGGALLSALLIVTLNALMALPFAIAALAPGFARLGQQHEQLCAQIGLRGWQKLRVADGPALKGNLMQALLLAGVMSFGDLAAVTLLGNGGLTTLPSLIAAHMGNYRGSDAGGIALLLTAICLAVSAVANRFGRTA